MSYLQMLHVQRAVLREERMEDEKRGIHRPGPVITPGLEVRSWGPFESPDNECPKGGLEAFLRSATFEERWSAAHDLLRKCGIAIDADSKKETSQ